MTVDFEGSLTGYQQTKNRYTETSFKPNRMASTRTRVPLQPRKLGGGSTSSSSSDDFFSGGSNAKRYWTLEESSHNENNKRLSSFAKKSTMRNSRDLIDNSNSSTLAQTGAPSFDHHGRSSSTGQFKPSRSGKPHLSRSTSDPHATAKSGRSKSEETIVFEEKRRKVNGDGFTMHRYIRGPMLGKGGFAKVYHCTALDTNKAYAVKIVPKANLVKPRAKQKVRKSCVHSSTSEVAACLLSFVAKQIIHPFTSY